MAVIAGWVSLLAMMSAALRSFWGTDYPPVWDNLSYQTLGLEAGRSILDGNWKYFLSWTGENVPPAYAFCIGLFHIFFGFSTSAPYYLSALFAFGILILIYLLAVELGAGRKESLFLVIFYSVLPNFIYQNFFQTRNDFILGFFIILFNYLVVLSLKQKDASVMFYAGISAGIGTLFKLSAPGYFIWIFIFFLIIPDVHNSFFVRLKCLLLAVAGAVLSCAWFYLPALPKIVRYYSKWTDYADGQYHLISISDRLFFYAKNFLFNHLTVPGTVFLLVFFLLSAVWTAFRKNREDIIQDYKESIKNSRIILIFAGYFSTVVFLTLRSSFSTAADNPLLPVFFSLIAAVSGGVTKRESFSPALYSCAVFVLLLFFLNSVSKIPKEIIPDKAEFISFASAVREFRQRY
ncbi:MAG TPA: glycosyltransferase family 39 protein, partial [Leptospiraceae bacterium]|nr:glycosyltransferase family 39 protein [Leptospiraceae bacterium]